MSASSPCTALRATSGRRLKCVRKICSPISHRDFFVAACQPRGQPHARGAHVGRLFSIGSPVIGNVQRAAGTSGRLWHEAGRNLHGTPKQRGGLDRCMRARPRDTHGTAGHLGGRAVHGSRTCITNVRSRYRKIERKVSICSQWSVQHACISERNASTSGVWPSSASNLDSMCSSHSERKRSYTVDPRFCRHMSSTAR